MDDNFHTMRATSPGQLSGPPAKTHGRGRSCVGCDGKLSIYNPEDACASCLHEETIEMGPEEIKAKAAAKLLGTDVRGVRAFAEDGRIKVHTRRRGLGTSYVADSVRDLGVELERERIAHENAADDVPDGSDPSYFGLSKVLCGDPDCASRDCINTCPGPLEEERPVDVTATADSWPEAQPLGNGDLLAADAAARVDGTLVPYCEGDLCCEGESIALSLDSLGFGEEYHVIQAEDSDREILALKVVRDAFAELDAAARVRVIAWTLDKYGLGANVREV